MKNEMLIIVHLFYSVPTFTQTDFKKYFDSLDVKGSTTVYDYNNKKWIFTDEKDAEIATLPASTFKIPHSLLALHYQAVQDENEVIKWDGEPKSHLGTMIPAWNQDTDLKTAFKNSTIWFYVEIAKKIKRKTYHRMLKKCRYGNRNVKEMGHDFWNYGDFAVSPKNQVNFLIKLYENKLPFSKVTMAKVKEIMISEKTLSVTYRDKTGWTRKNGQDIAWWVGYVESNENVYFFATRLIKQENEKNPNFLKGRKGITKRILKEIASQ